MKWQRLRLPLPPFMVVDIDFHQQNCSLPELKKDVTADRLICNCMRLSREQNISKYI